MHDIHHHHHNIGVGGTNNDLHHHGHFSRSNSDQYKIYVPPSTDKIIVIPLNPISGTFTTFSYSAPMTDNKVQEGELKQFLAPIEEKLVAWHQPSLIRFLRVFRVVPFILALVAIIGIPLSFMMRRRDDFGFPKIVLVVIPLLFVSILLMIITMCTIASIRKSKIRGITVEVRNYIEKNSQSYDQRHLYWALPALFPYWIELRKKDAPLRQDGAVMATEQTELAPLQPSQQGVPYQYSPSSAQPGLYPQIGQPVIYGQPGQVLQYGQPTYQAQI